jgi:hypothetical protein
MATRAEELAKIIGAPRFTGLASNTGYRNSGVGITGYIWPAITVLFLLFLILLVVHYTITPIFIFSIGDTGYIPLVQTNDGQLVWTKGPVASDLSANVLRILPNSFTVQMDVYVENQNVLGKFDRVFFYRAMRPVVPNNADTIMNQYVESNIICRLLPDTNDLVVSAITLPDPNNPETATLESTPTILNVPIRQPFRITCVLLPNTLEVYLNGRLFGTKTFRYPLKASVSYFFGPPDAYNSSVRIMNIQYWDRPLNSVEIRKAGPALPDISLFSPALVPAAKCT